LEGLPSAASVRGRSRKREEFYGKHDSWKFLNRISASTHREISSFRTRLALSPSKPLSLLNNRVPFFLNEDLSYVNMRNVGSSSTAFFHRVEKKVDSRRKRQLVDAKGPGQGFALIRSRTDFFPERCLPVVSQEFVSTKRDHIDTV